MLILIPIIMKNLFIYICIKYYLKKLTNDGMTYYLFNWLEKVFLNLINI